MILYKILSCSLKLRYITRVIHTPNSQIMKVTNLLIIAPLLIGSIACNKKECDYIKPTAPTPEKDSTIFFYSGTFSPPNMYHPDGMYNGDGKCFYQTKENFHSPAMNSDIIVNQYELKNDILWIDVTGVYTGQNQDIQAIKTKLSYTDYAQGSASDHNQFNGLYYSPEKNCLYALDYNKGVIKLFFLTTKTLIEKQFTWNDAGANGPEIGFLMDDYTAWYISYQPFAPTPMSGIYQLRLATNNTISYGHFFVIDDKRNVK